MRNLTLSFLWAAALLPYLASGQESKKTVVNATQLIASINASLKTNYVFPDKAQGISKALTAQAKANAYAKVSKDPQKLARQIQADMNKIYQDPHMLVEYNPDFALRDQGVVKLSQEEIKQAQNHDKEINYLFKKVEYLPGSIGYVAFNGFVEHVAGAKPIIASALGFLANSKAIILDLRENGGGEPEMVSQMESYFFKEKTPMNALIKRANQDTTFYYADPAKTNGLTLTMPVYILTSKRSVSAAEDFSYAMQQAKRATVVGEVTGGAAHPAMPFSVGQGFVVHIPFARPSNPVTLTDWEGTGVIPDVKVDAAKALAKAQELIFKDRQATAKTEKEKQEQQFLLNLLHVNEDLGSLPLGEFDKFTGTYGPLAIYREGNKLFCNINGTITELAHISKNLFVLDEGAHIEFMKDSNGTYPHARLFVKNGGVFKEVRK